MILFVLVCSVANAKSISSLSDTSASLYRSAQVPSHQYAARLTGVSPFFIPSSWSEPRPRTDSARFLHLLVWDLPQHTSSSGNQTLDLVWDVLQHFIGHPRRAHD